MKIADKHFTNEVFLAPLAGVSDAAFRRIAGKFNVGLTYTEMVSCKAITYKNKNTIKLLDTKFDIAPVAVQLFGSEPKTVAEAIKMIDELPFTLIDFNMGCPVPKVVNNAEGSSLLNNPKLVYEIVRAAKKATKKPFTVKIRKGFEKENAVEIAKVIEEAGADAIAIHARLRSEYYSGKADWSVIKKVKDSISIPVIGNGDVDSPEKYEEIKNVTNCDAVMIGRAAQGNPFIFSQIDEYRKNGRYSIPNAYQICSTLKEHASLLVETKGEYTAFQEIRKHTAWYTRGMKYAAELRRRAMKIENLEDLNELLTMIIEINGNENDIKYI